VLGSCGGVLGWVERTYMPRNGSAHRAEQMALLARLCHEMTTTPKNGELLAAAEASTLDEGANANVREIRRAYDRAVKLPPDLAADLTPLVAAILASPRKPDRGILHRDFPVETQKTFGRTAAEAIGYDFASGRLDVTTHPFCTGLGPGDVRITTRYNPNHFNE